MVRLISLVTDLVPPRYRFGRWQRLLQWMRPTCRPAAVARVGSSAARVSQPVRGTARDSIRCLIVAGSLNVGGIETVVARLASRLPEHGFAVDVAYTVGGELANELARAGHSVRQVRPQDLGEVVRDADYDVIQLHRIERDLLAALEPFASRTVSVFHAIEAYLNGRQWRQLSNFVAASAPSIAVSQAVEAFFRSKLGDVPIDVVVNGVAPSHGPRVSRRDARIRLAEAAQVSVDDGDVLAVALQRYSDQKNAAGVVDAFLSAAERDHRLRLIVAGNVDSWLEFRRADLVRRRHRFANRVHLLDDSDAAVVFAAGDVFVLDSFAEGGPIVAVEALRHGLPVVLSQVGFARTLLKDDPRLGIVVPAAGHGRVGRSARLERYRRHQSNRREFANALLSVVARGPLPEDVQIPHEFTEDSMVASHARLLREVATGR